MHAQNKKVLTKLLIQMIGSTCISKKKITSSTKTLTLILRSHGVQIPYSTKYFTLILRSSGAQIP